MSLADPNVLRTDEEDTVSLFTVSVADDDHRFEAWVSDEEGDRRLIISYQETHTWRGRMDVLPDGPETEVWDYLVGSDEFLDFLEQTGADTIRREH